MEPFQFASGLDQLGPFLDDQLEVFNIAEVFIF
jgi:hypothetical protein